MARAGESIANAATERLEAFVVRVNEFTGPPTEFGFAADDFVAEDRRTGWPGRSLTSTA